MLQLHSAPRTDSLLQALARLLADAPGDPFVREVVSVPTRGIERWISQRLSDQLGARPGSHDGICANIDFPPPGALIGDALATASGVDPRTDPWRPERLLWVLLAVIDEALEEPWLGPLARHFLDHPERRLTRTRMLAQLFDYYGAVRPTLIQAWAQGDGDHWQAALWRRLRDAVGTPSPAERREDACVRLRTQPELLDLPQRLIVFGLTRLPGVQLQVLLALAAHRDVHLMLLQASSHEREAVQNPLLKSWGRESRAFALQLAAASADPLTGSGDLVVRRCDEQPADDDGERDTLLGTIQRDVRKDIRPPRAPLPGEADRRLTLVAGDQSIRIHACHGRARQVEVLREAILHRLAADPTLEPRDVIVMCPDVEAFAPLIEAAFGGAEDDADDTRTLRVRIADRSLRQTNPVLTVIARLLELAGGRVTATEVLDLADSAPVRRRFGLSDDDLAQIREWVAAAAIHWGLDASSRAAYKLEQVESGTWAAGLRRLLLGVAFEGDGQTLFAGVLPLDAVAGGSIDLVGSFSELIDRLETVLQALSGTHDVREWADTLAKAADALTATKEQDSWQRRELDALLAEVVRATPRADLPDSSPAVQLALPDVRALLGHRLEGRPTRANFRTGHLTVCALTPMRSVPHRVVCILGLDDGVFPRLAPHDGDNLLLETPQPGDRDARAEDRQLLLDALMAAREALIITYTGNDERTNAPRPPAVPVGELLDVIDATARWEPDGSDGAGRRARDAVLVSHPLQAFDPRNFDGDQGPSPVGAGPWSFDLAALEGAVAFAAQRSQPPPFLDGPLPPPDDEDAVSLEDLVRFLQRPARAFLRQRLGISLMAPEDEVQDALPTELDGLARWGVGQRLLDARLDGADQRSAALAEIARGTLPPGALGEPVIRTVLPIADLLARHALAYAGVRDAASRETNLTLDGGTRLTGTVSGVHGHVLLTVSYSRLNARHRLAAWIRLLALTAAHPELPFEAITVARAPGREHDGSGVIVARIPQLGGDAETRRSVATAELEVLVSLRAEGLTRPLMLPCLSAAAYATAARQTGEDPGAATMRVWSSTFDRDGEDREPEHELVFGGVLDLTQLAQLAPGLWAPLLSREVIERP